ncbi:MAG: hypothetical protein WCJ81_01170 [bacterium]
MIEVKAKSGVRKEVTDDGEKKKIGPIDAKFLNDLSFQAYIINKALVENGLPRLTNIYIVYLNRDYIKQ